MPSDQHACHRAASIPAVGTCHPPAAKLLHSQGPQRPRQGSVGGSSPGGRRPSGVLPRPWLGPHGADGADGADVILPKVRDPRLVTVRRGGTLTDEDHQLLALWAAACAEHVLGLFEQVRPADLRPRVAIDAARGWARGELLMMRTRAAGGHAMGAARDLKGAARYAAYAAGQAAVVAHVAAHELGAAAYAIKAVRAAATAEFSDAAGQQECAWQRAQLPEQIKDLVLDDQRLRNDICWSVFDC